MGNVSLKVLQKSLDFFFKNGYKPCIQKRFNNGSFVVNNYSQCCQSRRKLDHVNFWENFLGLLPGTGRKIGREMTAMSPVMISETVAGPISAPVLFLILKCQHSTFSTGNPVNNMVTFVPKKVGRNIEVTVLTRISLQENVWLSLPGSQNKSGGNNEVTVLPKWP